MKVKKVEKKLSLKRLTVWNLDNNQVEVLEKYDLRVIKAGSENTIQVGVGVTEHPKYC
jgi:hypothetical protein